MRILLAIDGSACSGLARDLIAGIEWPAGTMLRVVAALEHGPALFGVPWMAVTPVESEDIEAAMAAELEQALAAADEQLSTPGVGVQHQLLRGRPADAVIDDAGRFRPDLIVVGSRGHGTLESMVLGSTSAEIVDHAPCPVLVARRTSMDHIVFAEDGSEGARAARDVLTSWPIWAGRRATAVSVGDVPMPWDSGVAPGMFGAMLETYAEVRDETMRLHEDQARDAAEALGRAGLTADHQSREGDAAGQLLRAADELQADLIMVGTRGRTGLSRLILGSVARNVLLHAHCSVLVVHAPRH